MSTKIFISLSDKELFALLLEGEAAAEPVEGKVAVASVVTNRINKSGWFGASLRAVILKEKQFSCFNDDEPDRPNKNRQRLEKIAADFNGALKTLPSLRECWWVANGFLGGWLRSNVEGACHYHTIGCDPAWDDNMKLVRTVGRHRFYETA